MDAGIVIAAVAAIAASMAVGVSVIAFRYSRKRDITQDSKELLVALIRDIVNPVDNMARNTQDDIKDINDRVQPVLAQTSSDINAVRDRVGVLETKVEVFWKNVAYDAAKILHSPHRPVLDALLEKYYEERITRPELAELADRLRTLIREGDDRGPVSEIEELAAAIVLRQIEGELGGRTKKKLVDACLPLRIHWPVR